MAMDGIRVDVQAVKLDLVGEIYHDMRLDTDRFIERADDPEDENWYEDAGDFASDILYGLKRVEEALAMSDEAVIAIVRHSGGNQKPTTDLERR